MTIEKLSEIKRLYAEARKQSKNGKVKISDFRELSKNYAINEININEFFKDFLAKCQDEISNTQFEEQVCKVEQALLTMCLGEKNTHINNQQEFIARSSLEANDSDLPKEGEKLRGSLLEAEDYTLDEYMGSIKDMVNSARDKKNYVKMTEEEIERFMGNLNDYVNIACKKLIKLNKDYAHAKAMGESKDYKDDYYKNVIKNYQENIYEYQSAGEKLTQKIEELFIIENDFKQLKDRNAELDMELLATTQDLERFKVKSSKLEIKLNQAKKDNKNLSEEASLARGNNAELKEVIYKLKEELEKVKKQVINEKQESDSSPATLTIHTKETVEPTIEPKEDIITIENAKKLEDLQRCVDFLQSKLDVIYYLINRGIHLIMRD